MRSGWDRIWVGLILGIITPFIVLLGYYKVNYDYLRFDSFIFKEIMASVLVPLVSLCVLGNLGVFYLFITKELYQGAKGVIFATLLYAAVVFAIKLFM